MNKLIIKEAYRKSKLPLLLAFVLTAWVLSAFTTPANAETICACAHKTNGKLRIVEGPGQCHTTEREISWDDGSSFQVQINTLRARVVVLEGAIGVINEPPSVDAGGDHTILLSSGASLDGSVSDDGILEPVTVTWTKESGPGFAFFDNANTEDTDVSFGQIGDYVLRLTAYDGLASVSDETAVIVFPDNTPPDVNAGTDQVMTGTVFYEADGRRKCLKCTTVLEGTATDDGLPLPLSIEWSGSGGVSFSDPHALVTSVTVSGCWSAFTPDPEAPRVVTLLANDGYHSVQDSLTITCQCPSP